MKYHLPKTVVVALGGSIVFPDSINWHYLKLLRTNIKRWSKTRRFILVLGGGSLARIYQEAALHVSSVTTEDKDWLGIHATRCNAHLVRTVLRDISDPVIIDARHKLKKLTHPVTIASGWRPGWSTDYIAVALAQDFNTGVAVIAGKPSHVYDKDFTKFKNAKPFDELTWKKYRTLAPKKWSPGLHAPVDPVAAALAQKQGIDAIVLDGRNIQNFEALLKGQDFEGTLIS